MNEKNIYLTRRQILRGGCALTLALMTSSCKTLDELKAAGEQLIVDVNKGARTSGRQTQQQRLIEKQALERIEHASKLTEPYAGIPISNFTKASKLFQANFSIQVKNANRDLWALSKLYWAELNLENVPASKSSMMTALKAAVIDVDLNISSDLRNKVGISLANALMTTALETNDIKMAKSSFRTGIRYVNEGFINNQTSEALHKLDLQKFFSLGACIDAREGKSLAMWNKIEQVQLQSKNALTKERRVESITTSFIKDALLKTTKQYNTVVSILVSPAEAYYVISTQKNGKLNISSKQIFTSDGKRFNSQSLEWLTYGSTFREIFIRAGMGGWLGAYAAQDNEGRIHSVSSNFYKKIESIAEDQWSHLFGEMKDLITKQGVEPYSKVAVIMPDEIAILPMRIAKHASRKKQFVDYYHFTRLLKLPAPYSSNSNHSRNNDHISGLFNPTGDLQNSILEKQFAINKLDISKVIDIPKNLSPKQFVREIVKNDSRCIFISTHGQTSGEKDNGISLGRGQPLTKNDLVKTNSKINAELVILSACEVGTASLGLNPEPSNLASAFLQLGAKGVISALWRVEENSTALLMCKFLELYFNEQNHPSVALTKAQIWLRDSSADQLSTFLIELLQLDNINPIAIQNILAFLSEGRGRNKPYSNPYYWGAFTYMEN